MRIICPIHGSQPVMYISPDLWTAPKIAGKECGGVHVVYDHECKCVDVFHLSAEFASIHGVRDGMIPLPDEYPKWAQAVTSVCQKCFEDKSRS